MNTVSLFLKISVWLYLLMGAALAAAVSVYLLIPVFAISLLVIWCAKSIDAQSKTGAIFGVGVMALYTCSAFFFLGIPGLIFAYRDRSNWAAW